MGDILWEGECPRPNSDVRRVRVFADDWNGKGAAAAEWLFGDVDWVVLEHGVLLGHLARRVQDLEIALRRICEDGCGCIACEALGLEYK